jgi:L-amino acid N-acyltransferase YncA
MEQYLPKGGRLIGFVFYDNKTSMKYHKAFGYKKVGEVSDWGTVMAYDKVIDNGIH